MRLDELIRSSRGEGREDELSYQALSDRAGGEPSMPTFHRLGSAPTPDEFIEQPWGGQATLRRSIPTVNVMGIAKGLRVSVRTVWLALGESLGLPGMFPEDGESLAVSHLPPGWWRLDARRLGILRTVISVLLDDMEREEKVAELEAMLEPPRAVKAKKRPTPAR